MSNSINPDCICAVADSFNVRASDLVNENCPIHGKNRPLPGQRTHQGFVDELRALINKHSRENGSGTPDYILAEYLADCITIFNAAVNRREAWYGREQDRRFGTPVKEFKAQRKDLL